MIKISGRFVEKQRFKTLTGPIIIKLRLIFYDDVGSWSLRVDEMKVFFHQTLVAMSDTFHRATQDDKMTATMKDFCDYFAEKLELKK